MPNPADHSAPTPEAPDWEQYRRQHNAWTYLQPWMDRHEAAYQAGTADHEAMGWINVYNDIIYADYLSHLREWIDSNA